MQTEEEDAEQPVTAVTSANDGCVVAEWEFSTEGDDRVDRQFY